MYIYIYIYITDITERCQNVTCTGIFLYVLISRVVFVHSFRVLTVIRITLQSVN